MPPKIPLPEPDDEQRLFNTSFYSFAFSFITIIAMILASTLLVGHFAGLLE